MHNDTQTPTDAILETGVEPTESADTEQEFEQAAEREAEAPATVDLTAMLSDVIEALPDTESITPYQVHSVLNTILEALGSDYTVRPQMMYNYARNGMIVPKVKDRKRFNRQEVLEFALRFIPKHAKSVSA